MGDRFDKIITLEANQFNVEIDQLSNNNINCIRLYLLNEIRMMEFRYPNVPSRMMKLLDSNTPILDLHRVLHYYYEIERHRKFRDTLIMSYYVLKYFNQK